MTTPKTSAVKISPARAAAFRILVSVAEGAHSDDLIFAPAVTALSEQDRNLTMALVMGSLRWQISLDAAAGALLDRPLQKMTPEVMVALRMGLFQLWYLDRIPDHAAISESVELCRAANHAYATGMVNAVLRKLARAGKPEAPKRKLVLTPQFLAEEYAHPEWMVARWFKTYGAAATEKILAADQSASFATTHGASEESEPDSEPVAASLFVEPAMKPQWPVIDEGSRLIAELAAAGTAEKILDCCAAPGGKTLVIALRHADAAITAADNSAERLTRMQQRLRKFPYAAKVQCDLLDATRIESPAQYDRILCDVPCSGTGTLARNPEIRHRLRAADLSIQAKRQRAILASALAALAPGGRLIYSTCSLEPEENEQVVETVLAAIQAVRVLPVASSLRELTDSGVLTPEAGAMLISTAVRGNYLRTLPGVHPCDGFFAAMMEKR
ncbi:MAG TPA: transcription antitermination factor NusB [Acidobacteriaceae bacterium]